MHITSVDERDGLTIYWVGTDDKPQEYGVVFRGEYQNISRQSLAESVALANDILGDAIERVTKVDGEYRVKVGDWVTVVECVKRPVDCSYQTDVMRVVAIDGDLVRFDVFHTWGEMSITLCMSDWKFLPVGADFVRAATTRRNDRLALNLVACRAESEELKRANDKLRSMRNELAALADYRWQEIERLASLVESYRTLCRARASQVNCLEEKLATISNAASAAGGAE